MSEWGWEGGAQGGVGKRGREGGEKGGVSEWGLEGGGFKRIL